MSLISSVYLGVLLIKACAGHSVAETTGLFVNI